MTNGDKIRGMTNDELAEMIKKINNEACILCQKIYSTSGVIEYLNQEVGE